MASDRQTIVESVTEIVIKNEKNSGCFLRLYTLGYPFLGMVFLNLGLQFVIPL